MASLAAQRFSGVEVRRVLNGGKEVEVGGLDELVVGDIPQPGPESDCLGSYRRLKAWTEMLRMSCRGHHGLYHREALYILT